MRALLHRRTRAQVLLHAVLAALTVLWAYPVLWTLLSSLKTSGELYFAPWALPIPPHPGNLVEAWRVGQLGRAYLNSALVTAASVLLILLISAPAAYAFARLRLPMRSVLYLAILLPLMVPSEVTLVPLFILLRTLGLLNRLEGLITLNVAGGVAFTTVILTTFFQAIPRELEDAAKIDGAGRLQNLRWIVLPLAAPGLMAVTVFQTVFIWNEFFQALIVIQRPELFTVQLAMGNFSTFYATNQVLLFAGLAIAIVPPLVVFVLLQRSFIHGLTVGAVRG
ncbi:MAG TPA: carbohydrate ABC transporter permease [Chloroflexota bacterium]